MQETRLVVRGRPVRLLRKGQGEPLLFLHGAGGLGWTPLLERLSNKFDVMATEHPGFGGSEMPEWIASVGDLAFFYLDVLDELNLHGLHLVGHSLGGWTAAELAIRNTRRLKTLTLLAPAGVKGHTPFGAIFDWSPEEVARRSCVDPALGEQRARAAAAADPDVARTNRAAAARLASDPLLHNPQLPFWLHRIDVPVLLAWGEQDQIIPFACAEPYVQAIPDARLVSMANAGHTLAVEGKDDVAEAIVTFVVSAGKGHRLPTRD